jgi:hypothetical protein
MPDAAGIQYDRRRRCRPDLAAGFRTSGALLGPAIPCRRLRIERCRGGWLRWAGDGCSAGRAGHQLKLDNVFRYLMGRRHLVSFIASQAPLWARGKYE